eukprot:13682337-Alexandrium_andersonii.AAC.1
MFDELVNLCDSVSTPADAVRALGLSPHPLAHEILHSGAQEVRQRRRDLVDIIYHCDGGTLFRSYAVNPPPQHPSPGPDSSANVGV